MVHLDEKQNLKKMTNEIVKKKQMNNTKQKLQAKKLAFHFAAGVAIPYTANNQ